MPRTTDHPCAKCGHEHEYEFFYVQDCINGPDTGGKCECKGTDYVSVRSLPKRIEGQLIPPGWSVTETSLAWYVRNRTSGDEISLLKIEKATGIATVVEVEA